MSSEAIGKHSRGRVKIKMQFIENKPRRATTFSKRKTGLMKKAAELHMLTGAQVMVLVASETGHVYTYATDRLKPMIMSDRGRALIHTCLTSADALASAADPSATSAALPPLGNLPDRSAFVLPSAASSVSPASAASTAASAVPSEYPNLDDDDAAIRLPPLALSVTDSLT